MLNFSISMGYNEKREYKEMWCRILGKLTKRQMQANETKERIYRTALELLERDGYENIRIEDICNQAQVSIGSFYTYFKSKNEILELIFKQADDYFVKEVGDKLLDLDSVSALRTFFEVYATYNQNTGILTMKQLYNPDNHFFTKKRGMQEVLERIVRKGQAEKSLTQDFESEELVALLFTVARGVVYDWCIRDGAYNLVDRMNLVMGQYTRAIIQ